MKSACERLMKISFAPARMAPRISISISLATAPSMRPGTVSSQLSAEVILLMGIRVFLSEKAGRPLLRHDQDVSIKHGIAVALKLERTAAGIFLLSAWCRAFQLEVLMDRHVVLPDGDDSVFDFSAGLVEFRRCEVDIVGLPG